MQESIPLLFCDSHSNEAVDSRSETSTTPDFATATLLCYYSFSYHQIPHALEHVQGHRRGEQLHKFVEVYYNALWNPSSFYQPPLEVAQQIGRSSMTHITGQILTLTQQAFTKIMMPCSVVGP